METAPSHWIPVAQELPPVGETVLTKIDDEQGCRNEQRLKHFNGLWLVPDAPTHWARD